MIEGQSISQHPYNQEKDGQQMAAMFVVLILYGVGYVALRGFKLSFPVELLLLFALMVPVAIGQLLIGSYRLWLRPGIEIYEHGLRYTDRRKHQFWRWEDIGDFRSLRSSFSQTGRYGLYSQNRRILLLDDRFQRSLWLVNYLLQELSQRRGYEKVFDSGETIQVGALRLSRSGLSIGSSLIPWSDIRAIWPNNHLTQVQIDRINQKPVKVSIRGIPDAPLLLRFVTTTLENRKHAPAASTTAAETPPPSMLESGLVKARSIIPITLAVIGLGAGLFVIGYGVVNGLRYHLIDWNWLFWGLVALIIPVISVLGLFQEGQKLRENPRLVADEIGLHQYTRSREAHWRWSDFSEIIFVRVHSWFKNVSVGLALLINGETVLTLDNRYTQTEHLGNVIQTSHANALYPVFKERFERGEMLLFGSLSLSQEGIHTYRWDEVVSFDVLNLNSETHLILYGENSQRLLATTIFGIPNLTLLTMLLQEQLKLK